MKKNIYLLITAFILTFAFSPSLYAGNVNTVTLEEKDNVISVKGSASSDVYAVAVSLYEGNTLIKFETTSVDESGKYELDMVVSKKSVYTVKVADYNGGNYISETINLTNSNVCSVDFNLGGLGEVAEIECGTKINKPEDPTKEGYKFIGWYLGNNEYNFNEVVNEDIVLEARWEEIKEVNETKYFTVKFSTGTEETIENQKVEEGNKAVKPKDPTRGGFEFAGWFLGENEYTFKEEVHDDIEIYAKWNAKKTDKEIEKTNTEVAEKTVEKFVQDVVDGKKIDELPEEVVDAIKEAVENDTPITIEISADLMSEDDVDITEAEEKAILAAAVEGDELVGFYDININLIIGNQSYELTKLSEEVSITLDTKELIKSLPEVKEGYKRIFKVIRLHNGKADVLDPVINSDNSLTIKTDKFSTYTVIYNDTLVKSTSPKTGDNIITFVIIFVISLIGLTTFVVLKKKHN